MTTIIIICDHCKGSGKIRNFEVTNYHNNDTVEWEEKCSYCDGYGRLLKIEYIKIKKLDNKYLKLKEK